MSKLGFLNKEIIFIDGMNLFHRVYRSYKYLSNKDGYPTGAIFGFLNSLLGYIEKYDSNKIIIFWEGKGNWRYKYNKNYKLNRGEKFTEEEKIEFSNSLKDVKEFISYLGILSITKDLYEADDTMAYLASVLKKNIIIISQDKDMLQLVSDKNNIKVIRPNRKDYVIFTKKEVVKTYKVKPNQMSRYLAIMGDNSDKIKGVYNYGKVRTSRLLNEIDSFNEKTLSKYFDTDDIRLVKKNLRIISLKYIRKRMQIGEQALKYNAFNTKEVKRLLDKYQIRKIKVSSLSVLNNGKFTKTVVGKLNGKSR